MQQIYVRVFNFIGVYILGEDFMSKNLLVYTNHLKVHQQASQHRSWVYFLSLFILFASFFVSPNIAWSQTPLSRCQRLSNRIASAISLPCENWFQGGTRRSINQNMRFLLNECGDDNSNNYHATYYQNEIGEKNEECSERTADAEDAGSASAGGTETPEPPLIPSTPITGTVRGSTDGVPNVEIDGLRNESTRTNQKLKEIKEKSKKCFDKEDSGGLCTATAALFSQGAIEALRAAFKDPGESQLEMCKKVKEFNKWTAIINGGITTTCVISLNRCVGTCNGAKRDAEELVANIENEQARIQQIRTILNQRMQLPGNNISQEDQANLLTL